MLQRVQTLYLLGATALMAIFFLNPMAIFSNSDGIFTLSAVGVKDSEGTLVYSAIYSIIMLSLATLLPFVNLFLFKRRMLQVRLCVVQMVLTLGALIVSGVYFYLGNRFFGADTSDISISSIRIVCILPLFAIFLDYMALKAILRDELLIKSIDRIR
ncbi:MAG: DUF4293 domain-containing protein [Rikenellaceae bacterium]